MYSNRDSTLQLVREFEERAAEKGHQSLVREGRAYAEDVGMLLQLSYPDPICRDADEQEVERGSVKKCLNDAIERGWREKVREEKW